MAEWLEAQTCNPVVPGSSSLSDHRLKLDLFRCSPLFQILGHTLAIGNW